MMSIQEIVQQRNITRLFHFTHRNNLSSIINNGLMSREALNNMNTGYRHNDNLRIDGHLDAICLSVSYPNSRMFYRYRCSSPNDWVLLALSPAILWDKDCAFYPTNAASNMVRFNDASLMKNPESFNAMFNDTFSQERNSILPSEYPTDVQAEVLVFDPIETSYFLNVYHPNQDSALYFDNLHPTIEHRYYANLSGKTLYSHRDYFLN